MSTTEAHTPTPWAVVHGAQIYGPDEENVATANRMRDRENQIANAAFIVLACNSFDALTEANKKLLQHVRDISSVVSFVGCEGSGDEICIDAEMAREDWCPMCRIGECVQDAIKGAK